MLSESENERVSRVGPGTRFVSKTFEHCNWLQAMEGGLDTAHSSFLHNEKLGDKTQPRYRYASIRNLGDDGTYVRVYQYAMPFQQMRGRITGRSGGRVPNVSAGIKGINTQDMALQEGMGPICDRTQEQLGTSDRAVIAARQLLLEASDDVEQDRQPRGADPATNENIRPYDSPLPANDDWHEAFSKELVAKW
ncbi:MAG: hypothetical protein ABSH03_13470 [Candidatus Lustribacter sp.]|jgi:hypothetical protein